MKNITAKERREAIEICALMASSNSGAEFLVGGRGLVSLVHQVRSSPAGYLPDACEDGNCHTRSAELARQALWVVELRCEDDQLDDPDQIRRDWAEAECLLRDGWSPGEPLHSF